MKVSLINKKWIAISVVLFLLNGFISCQHSQIVVNKPITPPINEELPEKVVLPARSPEIGNIPGNINNEGLVTVQGDWIYYHAVDGLCKIRIDGTRKTILSKVQGKYINVVGDWIYYCNLDNHWKLYKMRTDGSENILLNDHGSYYINVVGDWIYFLTPLYDDIIGKKPLKTYSEGMLYRIRTNGADKTLLNDSISRQINVVGDWIYYINVSDQNKIYRIKTDGTGKTMFIDAEAEELYVSGEWIFFVKPYYDQDNGFKMYKAQMNDTKNIQDTHQYIRSAVLVGDWIFFSEALFEKTFLYKMKIDGTHKKKLNTEESEDIQVVGDWIYYTEGTYKMTRIRTDGTGRQKIE